MYQLVRPPRAFERSASDVGDLVLVPMDLEAAYAQEFVKKRGEASGFEDSFLSYLPITGSGSGQDGSGKGKGDAIILSEIFVYWRQTKSLWGRTWSNVSHCFFMLDSVAIVLYGGDAQAVVISCGDEKCARKIYSAFYDNRHRMGCPSNMIPADLLAQESSLSEKSKDALMERKVQAASLAGILDGYRFGNANSTKLKKTSGPEKDVLKRMAERTVLGYRTLAELDDSVWRLVWEWDCAHPALQASRSCATLLINRSHSPLQIAKIQLVRGRNVLLLGSEATGYEVESR